VADANCGLQPTAASLAAPWKLIVGCDQFCVAFRDQYGQPQTVALDRVDVLIPHESPGTLVLQIRDT
jgi:hypothetical protein